MARAVFKSWFIDFDPVKRNMERAGRNQPSPASPLPKGEGPQQRGGYAFAGLKETVRELRAKSTPAESVLWELLRGRKFLALKFRRQHQIGDYVADLYCHERRLVIELDGGIHAKERVIHKDAKRDAYLQSMGFHVLRFPNDHVIEDPESILRQIAAAAPLPSPLGRGVGGEGGVDFFDALFPDAMEDSPLGKIPKGWKVRLLPNVIEINPTRSLPKDEPAPYVDMQNMPVRGHRVLGWIDRSAESGTKFMNGDTLVARITPCLENGKTAYVDFLSDGAIGWGSTEYIVLHPKPPLPGYFGYCLARSNEFRNHAILNMTGTSGRQRVPPKCFDQYQITVPPEPVAIAFGEIINPWVRMIKPSDEESRTLSAIRDALLPKLMLGGIQIN